MQEAGPFVKWTKAKKKGGPLPARP
jgi:hypothetical protein